MKWVKDDCGYHSEDERFTLTKDTDRIHRGDWELYDSKTKSSDHKPTLKWCKQIAEQKTIKESS